MIMDLEAELLREHSRRQAERIARWVGPDARRLRRLMDCFLSGERLVAQRAAWVVTIHAGEHPGMYARWLPRMVARIQEQGIHDAVRRCVVHLLQSVEIPRPMMGMVATICFRYLGSADQPIAVRVFSMTVLQRIAEREPDLGRELRLVIEQQLPYAGAGFRARARRTLAALNRSAT
jgi:hypothetical protein